MKKPKMILFDYGQTLVNEIAFKPLEGTRAVLAKAAFVPEGVTAEGVQALADELSIEMRRSQNVDEETIPLEIHINAFQNYLYEYFGVELAMSSKEVEQTFAAAALKVEPTKHMDEFLSYLSRQGIRTGVISNITFSGQLLSDIITTQIPSHNFEFILASSEYIFRKPHPRLFELALRKANLKPEDVWYCGDNPLYDVKGAANSNVFPVLYQGAVPALENQDLKHDCLIIQDWRDVIEILEQL